MNQIIVLSRTEPGIIGTDTGNGVGVYIFNSVSNNILCAFFTYDQAAFELFPGISAVEARMALDNLFSELHFADGGLVWNDYSRFHFEYNVHDHNYSGPRYINILRVYNPSPQADMQFWGSDLVLFSCGVIGFGVIATVFISVVGFPINPVPQLNILY